MLKKVWERVDKMQEMEVEYVTLEDGCDYFIVDIIDNFVYLKKEDDDKTFEIRELVIENNGEEFFAELINQEDYKKALMLFTTKYNVIEETL